jgi:hypothetical protein
MPDVITAAEYLEIASVPLATPAWRITSLTPLRSSAPRRGSNRVLPHAPGRRAQRRRVDEAVVALEMVIWGDRNRENTAYGSVRVGLQTNWDALHAALVDDPGGDSTRTAVWHRASGTLTAPVQVLGLIARDLSPRSTRATLQLAIPQGRFT